MIVYILVENYFRAKTKLLLFTSRFLRTHYESYKAITYIFRACIADLEECRHPTVMKEMCAGCGADLRTDESRKKDTAVVPMVHSVPELKVSTDN